MKKRIGIREYKRLIPAILLVLCVIVGIRFPVLADESGISVYIPVEQAFTAAAGSPSNADSDFRYSLIAAGRDVPLPEGGSDGVYKFSLSGSVLQNIGPIQYTHAGIYTYELHQTTESMRNGYSYDDTVYFVTVQVLNTKDSGLKATMIIQKKDGAKDAPVRFTNSYKAAPLDPELMYDPPLRKKVNGSPDTASEFSFVLRAETAGAPMPAGSIGSMKTIQVTGGSTGWFGNWVYDTAGKYVYTVYEADTGIAGYTYDKSIYTVTDIVGDKDGKLEISRKVTDNRNREVSEYSFTNAYSKPVNGSFSAKGSLTGDASELAFYSMTAALAAAAAGVTIIVIKRKKKNKPLM